MNDDFEKLLQRQSLRQIPADWRDEVLGAAQTAMAANEVRAQPNWRQWPVLVGLKLWRELIWPCRRTWAAFVALWLLVLAVNVSLRDPGQLTLATSSPPTGIMTTWQQQERLLAELTEPHKTRVVTSPPKPAAPQPRSDRRDASRRPVYA